MADGTSQAASSWVYQWQTVGSGADRRHGFAHSLKAALELVQTPCPESGSAIPGPHGDLWGRVPRIFAHGFDFFFKNFTYFAHIFEYFQGDKSKE
jgi:hypothetical protein